MDRTTGRVGRFFKLTALAGFPAPSYTGKIAGRRDYTGSGVACLGDLDGDGDLEVIVGAEVLKKGGREGAAAARHALEPSC